MSEFVGSGGKLDELGYTRLLDELFTPGVAFRTPTAWQVQQDGAGTMNVVVGQGVGLIEKGTTYAYPAWSDADYYLAVTAAHATLGRKDIVVAYIDLSLILTSVTNNPGALKFMIVNGTASGSPADPSDGTIQTAVGASNPWKKLGRINVAAAATQIFTANVDDLRTGINLRTATQRTIDTLSVSKTGLTGDDVELISSSGATRTYTFPDATIQPGKVITVVKSDSSANPVNLATTASQTLSGATSGKLSKQYMFMTFMSDGSNWILIGSSSDTAIVSNVIYCTIEQSGQVSFLTGTGDVDHTAVNTGVAAFPNGVLRGATTPGGIDHDWNFLTRASRTPYHSGGNIVIDLHTYSGTSNQTVVVYWWAKGY